MEPPNEDPKARRRRAWAWVLYDVGNSAFYLTVVAAIFPFFYQDLYARARGGSGREARTHGGAALALTAGIAMAVVALLGPLLGTLADRSGSKKRFLAAFMILGASSCLLMTFIPEGGVLFASLLYALGTVGVAGSIVFYDALLPAVARPEETDRVSSLGYAMGYLGSVVLLGLNLLWIRYPERFGLRDVGQAARLSFASVGLWWALFTLPLLRGVPEPPAAAGAEGGGALREGFRRLARTLREIRRYRELVLFLIAYWIYSDGIGTIIKMASAFGYSMGVGEGDLILALLLTQLIGVPCALAFGLLARHIGSKGAILLGLGIYTAVCVGALFMSRTWHFYALAAGVGLVQGGTQALSRSLYASMIPPARAGEFFGFFSTMEKFAGILGPLLLSLLWGGRDPDPRRGIVAVALFFAAGALMLWKVDVEAGRRAANG